MKTLALAVTLAMASCSQSDTPGSYALPDPLMTPGAVETSDLAIICHQRTSARRHVEPGMRAAVFSAYSIGRPFWRDYELDHIIPLALGGSNAAANLWPEPILEAKRKDRLELVMHDMVCAGTLPLARAQRAIATDWPAAADRWR